MIFIALKQNEPVPNILTAKGKEETEKLCRDYDNGITDFKFASAVYGHREVKGTLMRIQYDKCCFCESYFRHITPGDVEHYRPKGGWIQDKEPLNKPGYYWLAYQWDNLLVSCSKCNQSYKKNKFPLADNSKRALKHTDDINQEHPILIHPATEDPAKHITFNEEVPKGVTERGKRTIEILGLDNNFLNERRRDELIKIKLLYKMIRNSSQASDSSKTDASEYLHKCYINAQNGVAQYSSMLNAFFQKNPL